MGTESKDKTPLKVVKLDKGLKLAEAWVNKMSAAVANEQGEVEFEGRPSRLGLGAKIAPKAKVAVSIDAVERKLLGKLNSRKKLSSEDAERNSPVKEKAPSEEDENEPESRTSSFVKKRRIPLATNLQSNQKRK